MSDPLKRGVFRTPSVQSPDRPGTGLLTHQGVYARLRGLCAGGSSPPGFTKDRPVAERFSGGFLIRVNAGSIPAGSTNRACDSRRGAP
jgi:hypothetical protein